MHRRARLAAVGALLCASPSGANFMPARTAASRYTGDMVHVYMDSRSVGPSALDLFVLNSNKFGRLLAYHNDSSDNGGGVPVDTLFDSFLLTGDSWWGGKNIWPGIGPQGMNKTDWLGYLKIQLSMGAHNLDIAAKNITAQLPFPKASYGGLRPTVTMSIPYPDPRLQSWGSLEPGGRSLNFSLLDDRITAVNWYVHEATAQWESMGFERVTLSGWYWYLEELIAGIGDDQLIRNTSAAIKAIDPGLMFVWVPYYKGMGTPHLDEWRSLGFDLVMLQPNYAFNNISAAERFEEVRQLTSTHNLGVEIEIGIGIRNPQAGGWRGNFKSYVQHVESWHSSIMRSYYYGNVFVDRYSANRTEFEYYTRLYNFVKGVTAAAS